MATATVTLVSLGVGYLSMAIGLSLGVVAQFVMVTRYRPNEIPWMPKFRGIKETLSFGSFAAVSSLARTAAEGVPDLILGKAGTMTDVGLFSKALGLVVIFDQAVTMAISPVVLPHLSKENRATDSIVPTYCRIVEYHTGLAWPFFAVLSVISLPLVRLLYGDQWDASAPIATIISL